MSKRDENELRFEHFLDRFHTITKIKKPKIHSIISKRLGAFEEAANNINLITENCIADIERILIEQLHSDDSEHFNFSEKKRKLALFAQDHNYVERYTLEAVKSFCRKKQHYWTHGRAKADTLKGEKHKELKAGRAARVHWKDGEQDLNDWLSQISSSEISIADLSDSTNMALEDLLRRKRFKYEQIQCFFDRLDGRSFVEMAAKDADTNVTPDKYRKRFNRMVARLERNKEELRDILLANDDKEALGQSALPGERLFVD